MKIFQKKTYTVSVALLLAAALTVFAQENVGGMTGVGNATLPGMQKSYPTAVHNAGGNNNDNRENDNSENGPGKNSDASKQMHNDSRHSQPGNNRSTQKGPGLQITPEGNVTLVQGEVSDVSWPNPKVKIFGLVVSVSVNPDAHLEGVGDAGAAVMNDTASSTTSAASATLSLTLGDKVDVTGKIDASGVIHASGFRDTSHASLMQDSILKKIQELMHQIEQLRALQRSSAGH